MKKAGIYIHFPFCKRRCNYCDFSTCAGMDDFFEVYIQSLQVEIKNTAKALDEQIQIPTIYLGGGTPSYLPPELISQTLEILHKTFSVIDEAEISMESNPADIDRAKAGVWKNAGINRLSIGMQSGQDKELELLSRRHRFHDVQRAFETVRDAGFDNINLDLMFGLPDQSMQDWQDSLEQAIALNPEHFSLYSLTVEKGTPLWKAVHSGEISAPDEDLAGDMYAEAMDLMAESGFAQYEISNWAKRVEGQDYRCKHNLIYWRNENYLGFGSSAHSHYISQRWANKARLQDYLRSFGKNSNDKAFPFSWTGTYTEQTQREEIGDTVMMGLRLTQEGIVVESFDQRFDRSFIDLYSKEISKLKKLNLIEVIEEPELHIRLTKEGRFVGNQVFLHFIPDQ